MQLTMEKCLIKYLPQDKCVPLLFTLTVAEPGVES